MHMIHVLWFSTQSNMRHGISDRNSGKYVAGEIIMVLKVVRSEHNLYTFDSQTILYTLFLRPIISLPFVRCHRASEQNLVTLFIVAEHLILLKKLIVICH